MGDAANTDGASAADLVEVAFANDLPEAEMIQGLLDEGGIPSLLQPTGIDGRAIGIGLLPPGAQRVAVHIGQAEAARNLLTGTLVEDQLEAEAATANAGYLEDASGRGPRSYGLIGAYARILLFSFAACAVASGVFLLLRVL